MPKLVGGLLGEEYAPKARNALSGRFIVPPFTVLNAREGWWQERKRAWLSLGIRSELGRGENLLKFSETVMRAQRGELEPKLPVRISPRGEPIHHASGDGIGIRMQVGKTVKKETASLRGGLTHGTTIHPYDDYGKKRNAGIEEVGNFRTQGKSVYLHPPDEDDEGVLTGTSIFDPVLCEISYRWYCPEGGRVLDPFSGGSVRGIVAGELGLFYSGVDLSGVQVEANRKQGEEIGTKPAPRWEHGDSLNIQKLVPGEYDFIWSCPPYGDLEKYSDDPHDISAMSVEDFDKTYYQIIQNACAMLKPGRFAAFVVGDYRDDAGFYNNFPLKTIMAFEDAGCRLYNECILVTSVGSLPMRINKQFGGSRKLGKTHQNVLVFAKGNPKEFLPTWPGNLLDKEIK